MITILSPAKNMIMQSNEFEDLSSNPIFIEKSMEILNFIKNYEPFELESLMKVNSKIAMQTFINFQEFDILKKGTLAILAYNGIAFKNLNAKDFSKEDFLFANNNLFILSGFYGLLKACDSILPYRLEMQCNLKFLDYKNLYEFWGDLIYKELYKNNDTIVNLASNEYSKVIHKYLKKENKFIEIVFITLKNGKFKTIATEAKALRGQMARFIVKNKITDIQKLKDFEYKGYSFDYYLSNENKYVFKN